MKIGVPLKYRRQTIGVMFLYPQERYRLRRGDLRLMGALGAQIGVALENTRLHEREHAALAELRASEERYRDLFENANDIVYAVDPAGNLVSVNRAATVVTGYSREELIGQNLVQLLDPESRPRIRQLWSRALDGEPVAQPFQIAVRRKDGSQAILGATIRPTIAGGKVVGAQGIARDITEPRQLRTQLQAHLQGIIRAREDERHSLARDLHDDTAQKLVAITRLLDVLSGMGRSQRPEHAQQLLGDT